MNAPEKLPSPAPHVMNTYGRLPFALSHGRGCWVWDTDGKKYLDGLGGIAVNTLGHGHPKLVPALQDQVAKLIHSSNYYQVPLQEQLAAKLCELSGLTNAFFCSTGLEANEEVARAYAEGSPSIVTPLNRYLGYDEAAAIAKQALATGRTIREVVIERGHVASGKLSEMQLDEALDVLRMTRP